jgi:membrane protein
MEEAQLMLVASSLAYTTILSIIPVLAVSFSIFKAFGGLEKLYSTIEPLIINNLAEGVSEEAIAQIRTFIGNIHVGAIGVGGFIGLLITTMIMLNRIEIAINHVWRAPTTRPIFQRFATYWVFITLGPLAASVIVGVATSSDYPITKILPGGTGILLITIGFFFLLYKFVPNRPVDWKPSLVAATFTAIVWNVARLSYLAYVKHVVTYGKIYGGLASIPILLVWIYIVWLIVLTGAALTAALQKRVDFS